MSVRQGLSLSADLPVGLDWWLLAIVLAIGYFIYLFHLFRGKVEADAETPAVCEPWEESLS